jgi:hypothetical protein
MFPVGLLNFQEITTKLKQSTRQTRTENKSYFEVLLSFSSLNF